MSSGTGIFGGTFDPIHLGHLRAAEEVREALGLAEVCFVPAATPPHRRSAPPVAPAEDRYRMVQLGIADNPGFRCWDIEVSRAGPSYSIDTVRAARDELGPAARLVLVLGVDAFRDFETWKDHATLLTLCDIAVLTRPPAANLTAENFPLAARKAFRYDPDSDGFVHESGHVLSLQRITSLDISATAIRARVAARRSIRFLVPCAVERYIAEHRLYRQEDGAR